MFTENPFEESNPTKTPPLPPKKQTIRNEPQPTFGGPDPKMAARAEQLKRMEEDLNRREVNLDERSKILIAREKDGINPRTPNWPRCKPIVYQDIKGEIHDTHLQRLVTMGYIGWISKQ